MFHRIFEYSYNRLIISKVICLYVILPPRHDKTIWFFPILSFSFLPPPQETPSSEVHRPLRYSDTKSIGFPKLFRSNTKSAFEGCSKMRYVIVTTFKGNFRYAIVGC